MLLKLICCDVFTRMACKFISTSKHRVDVEFVPMLAHIEPKKLKLELQTRIDCAASEKKYDAILLAYGLCGNATVGIKAPMQMIIPRMHDCCTMFMGGKEAFNKVFGEIPSTRWCCNGYYERCHIDDPYYAGGKESYKTSLEYLELVEKYGEDNAEYVWEVMHPEIETNQAIYIKMPEYEFSNSKEMFREEIEKQQKTLKVVQGSDDLFRKFVYGEWDKDLFLQLDAGETIEGVYDKEQIIKSKI